MDIIANLVFPAKISRQERQGTKSAKKKLSLCPGAQVRANAGIFSISSSSSSLRVKTNAQARHRYSAPHGRRKALFWLGALGFLALLARAFWLRPTAALRSTSEPA
ncbi:MAG TPA: hypothetical protein VFE47_30365 [Tepidisphaeraceae bacterium]|jgi:hypothetical protein|nr:hypothetical protein [Tepidisphaeraceae bacterium]